MKRWIGKALKIAGLVLGALVLLLAVAGIWFVRRPWPQVDGEVTVSGLTTAVEIVRDRWGIPHIQAGDEHDLFFAQGWAHAQDRLWQMHLNRVTATGRLAATFGEAALEGDRFFHALGLRRAAEGDWETLDEANRSLLAAYSEGVNAFLDSHRGRLPVEFTVLGVDPEPWEPVDSLAWMRLMSLNLALNMRREIQRTGLVRKLGEEGEETAGRFLPAYPAAGPYTVPPGSGLPGSGPPGSGPPGSGPPGSVGEVSAGEVARTGGESRSDRFQEALRRLAVPVLASRTAAWGSNAWVVHGSRTASGKPLLANDTHLLLGMPSIWYENGLHGGRFDVVGFSLPGMPLVITGHNGRIAWGITNMVSDVQDLFVEELDGEENPARYRFGDGWRELIVHRESVEVKGKEPIEIEVKATHHGPLINGFYPQLAEEPPMALSWTANSSVTLLPALAALNRAGGWQEFRAALRTWQAPSLNFLYADVDGNIGYQGVGLHPIRAPGHDGTTPVSGSSGEYEWQGFVAAEELPWALNPEAGFLVNANNQVVSGEYPHLLTHDWAGPQRAQRITDLLSADADLTREEMAEIQGDTYSLAAEALRPYLLAAAPEDDLEARARGLVESWDLRYEADRAGASVFFVWQWKLLSAIAADEVGEELMKDLEYTALFEHPTLDRWLARAEDPWYDDRATEAVEGRSDVVERSLGEAVAWLARRYGDDPEEWRWGRLHPMAFAHMPLGQTGIGLVDGIFNSTPVPSRGGPATVFSTHPSLDRPFAVVSGTSQRFLADLADLDRSLAVNSTGQCAHLFHRHREDQVALWQDVEYHPVIFSRADAEAQAEGILTLSPP